ncbi:MAG TPA: class I SAM-dependent methyltransferase [Xanthomonadaceae bacterium]|jgi:SAM-dependent methyltransferase|nr:class I SAM-dependent methyltransferase [Xanthomonadaceae bacterium]
MPKHYDRRYFDRWYREDDAGIGRGALLRRKVALAVAMAEHYLGRPLRSVLDVGCGEGAWRAPLLKLRPKLDYLGVDSSEYAVARYGAKRNLRLVHFRRLSEQRFGPPVDLLICADVLHYLPTADLRSGLSGFAELCTGMAYIEAYCKGDAVEGDEHDFVQRSAAFYRRAIAKAGFTACGSNGYLAPSLAADAVALELIACVSPSRGRQRG